MKFDSLRGHLTRHDARLRSFCRVGFAVSIFLVCVLSLLPGDELPDLRASDKAAHLIAYAEIVVLGMLGFRGTRATVFIVAGIICLGVLLEIGQHFVPGRSGGFPDVVANSLGVLTGAILARWLMRLWPVGRRTGC